MSWNTEGNIFGIALLRVSVSCVCNERNVPQLRNEAYSDDVKLLVKEAEVSVSMAATWSNRCTPGGSNRVR